MKTSTKVAVLSIASALVLAVPAAAGGGTTFKGKTDRKQQVSFKVSGGKVKDFAATVFLVCGDGDNGFNAVIPPKPLKVKGGKFSYKGRDRVDGANIEIKGTIKGGTAKGTVRMTDTNYSVTDQSIYACTSGTPKWTAKAK